jgi:hypothetical protein
MDMGILSNPGSSGILLPPKTQNQQYQYSAQKNFARNQLPNQTFSPMTNYFGSGFKQIGVNDPLYNSKQIFYNSGTKDQQGRIFGKQNKLRDSLMNNNGFGFKMNNKEYSNINPDNTINIHQKNTFDSIDMPSKFRGSFNQTNNKLPDTPVFKQINKRASNLRKLLEKRDNEEALPNKKEIKKEMLDPRISTKKKSKKKIDKN